MARRVRSSVLALLCALLLSLVLQPTFARAADSYVLSSTDIFATVRTDGSIVVIEERELDLNGGGGAY